MILPEQLMQRVRAWLSSSQGYGDIAAFVAKKIAVSWSGSMPWQEYGRETRQSERGNAAEEAVHDFLVFLLAGLEDSLRRQPNLVQILLNGNFRLFLDLQWNRFIWDIQERARSKRDNPIGYLYRRFREIVKSGDEFHSATGNDGLLYFMPHGVEDELEVSLPNGNVLANETYTDWPPPPESLDIGDDGDIRVTRQWLISTAHFFRQHANRVAVDVRWFAVKEIVRYLGTVHAWLNKPQLLSASSEDQGERTVADTLTSTSEDSETRLARLQQLQSIAPLAVQLVDLLTREECCVFYWRSLDTPRSYQEIATILALKSHNQAYSIFTRVMKKIRMFCSTWPGPPVEDLEKDVAEVFIESLVGLAKNKCSGP
ncbi:MAG: hypothetical protein WBN83_03320 [Desulfoprunum sp.]|uniref:hypothetical protein n=1 Tax=Desulfoprunum sp. TaxID=2020866 RepID=UPI00052B5AAF|nr:hypothetical protein JT06_10330 [Desulfobulbus sp. Tol-SR]